MRGQVRMRKEGETEKGGGGQVRRMKAHTADGRCVDGFTVCKYLIVFPRLFTIYRSVPEVLWLVIRFFHFLLLLLHILFCLISYSNYFGMCLFLIAAVVTR